MRREMCTSTSIQFHSAMKTFSKQIILPSGVVFSKILCWICNVNHQQIADLSQNFRLKQFQEIPALVSKVISATIQLSKSCDFQLSEIAHCSLDFPEGKLSCRISDAPHDIHPCLHPIKIIISSKSFLHPIYFISRVILFRYSVFVCLPRFARPCNQLFINQVILPEIYLKVVNYLPDKRDIDTIVTERIAYPVRANCSWFSRIHQTNSPFEVNP